MLKIAQLSDLHLLADPTENRWGLNPQQGFEQVLALALEHQPDALLLTGDLVHDESDAGYQRLWQQTQATGLPTLAIAGNHDNPAKIRALFSEATLELNGLTVIGLNSHINGSDGGRLGEEELAQAEATIQNAQQPVLIAMHHPPVAVGSRWIDELGLADADQFLVLVEQYRAQIVGVVCGHIHQDFSADLGGVPLSSSPSTNRQFLPGADEFATEDIPPGFRLYTFDETGLSSRVIRLP